MKARNGYKLDAKVAKASNIANESYPNYCPCCKSWCQTIEHWLIDSPFFNSTRSKFSTSLDTILIFIINEVLLVRLIILLIVIIWIIITWWIILCIIILLCVKKYLNSFLVGELIIVIKKGNYIDTPFLVVTVVLLNEIMPIAIGQQWFLFNRFNTKTTKSVNAEETVGQVSITSATNNDQNIQT